LQPLKLNRVQRYLHEHLQAQLRERGYVRALVLKGRQQGCSTYIEGRFFWRVSHLRGKRAMILTHMQDATDNLFGMVDRFYEHCPDLVKPHKGKSNSKELSFDALDSSYRASTAGSKGTGRSETVQFFHGSEVAFWPNAAEHQAGALQAVPMADDTEIIFETTANGVGEPFHLAWQDAEAGKSDFEAIFLPWYWQEEYRLPVPPDFALDDDEDNNEVEYKEIYGLDDEQMAWRRAKIIEFRGDVSLFRREYPATAAEAFEESSDESLIKPSLVTKARKTKLKGVFKEPLVIGIDPAGEGRRGDPTLADRTAIIRREGGIMYGKETYLGKDPMQLVGIIAKMIEKEKPEKVFIDVGERGHGIVSRLHEMGYTKQVMGVAFGAKAAREDVYQNKRAEIWDNLREWLETPGGVEIPDDNELHADLVSVRIKQTSVTTKLLLESKVDMKKRGVRSPDVGDAAALTFAFPVARLELRKRPPRRHRPRKKAYNPLRF